MKSIPMMVDLIVILLSLSEDKKYEERLKAKEVEYKAVVAKMCEHVKPHQAEIDKLKKERPLIYHTNERAGSKWFNNSQPYRSIVRFTGRCASLSVEEQNRFLSAVRHFFTTQAYHNQCSKIPRPLKDRVVNLDLPFLLQAMQYESESERKRVLTCVQFVTKQQFSSDTVVALNRYGNGKKTPSAVRIGWVTKTPSSASSSSGKPPYTELQISSKEFL